MQEIITQNLEDTRQAGRDLAKSLEGGEIICLSGELGAGKTTFSQGILESLGAVGPYTSPTFIIMKQYELESKVKNQKPKEEGGLQAINRKLSTIYHIDAYRINEDDLLNLAWEEITRNKENIVILEWPEKVEKILPDHAIKIELQWLDENRRKIIFQ